MASSRCSLDGGGATAASTPTTTTPASDDLSRRSGDAREKGDIFDPAAAAAVVAATAAAAVDSSCQQQQQQHQQQASSLDGSASGVDDDNDDDDDCCCDDASVYSPASFESARKHPTVAATAPAAAQQPPLSASSSSASSVPPLPPAEEEEAEAVVMDDDELDDAFDEMGDASDDARPKKTTTKPAPVTAFNFSFALGGWLMIYNFGVAKCLLDHGLHKVDPERQSIIGSSAGSLSAAALVLEADIDKIVDQAKTSFIPRAHNAKILGFVYGMFFIGTFLKESMLECLPVSRVPDKTSVPGRLIVVMSSLLGWGSIRAKEFDNGQELIDALRCSCAIFPLVMPHRFRGKRCFDGFFSEGTSAPTLDDEESAGLETVSISPFYASSASIRPSRYVPLSWIALAPRDPAAIDWLYDLGYRDALFWMAKRGIEHTCTHHPRRSKEHQKETHESPATARSKAGGCCGSSSAGVGVGASGSGSGSGSTKLGAGKSAFEEGDSDDDDDCGVADAWDSAKDLPSPSKSSGGIGCGGGGGESLKAGSSEQWAGKKGTSADVIAGRIEGSSDGGVEGVGGGGGGGGDASGGEGGAAKKGIGGGYLRKSFVLSGCHMRPQRERHPQLDEPAFVPSLEQFVGHGSYNAVADFLFVVFFNIAWRPATALLLYADLISRLSLATIRGVWMELRELLGWIIPALVLAGVCLERGPTKQECSAMLAGVAGLLVIACSRERCASAGEWRTARRCVRGLFDRRILLSCLPWGHRGNVRSEALESSFLYRAVSFFM